MTAVQFLSTGHPFSGFLKGHDSSPLPLTRALPTLYPGNPTRNKGYRNHLCGSNLCHAALPRRQKFPAVRRPMGRVEAV